MASVAGKVCVVTGGASGIGTAICRHLAAAGAQAVVVADLNEQAAKSLADEIGGTAVRCNVAQEMDIRRLIRTVETTVGQIEVFISNAGIPSNGSYDVSNDEWQRIFEVNVLAHVLVARHLFPLWERREGEKYFTVTASAAGLLTQVGSLPYSVTKHAAVGLAEWLAITYAEYGINVSCLCPQAVESGMTAGTAGGVAGGDGVLPAEKVAKDLVDAMDEKRFMVLPHPEVQKYFVNKAKDHNGWIKRMGKLQSTFGKFMMGAPNLSAAKL